ncbi:MAG: asparagine synthase B [Spirochaetaceae bacterium]|jgi:asparagine synthase (glutamine-hydrolysing)|nr:asparagine synthase B [Spirochaetaceae bacterium]
MGYTGRDITLGEFSNALSATVARGPDMQEAIALDKGYLGFNRLAIMDMHPAGMQPFELKGNLLACNGEVYLFRDIKKRLEKKGYLFKSGSDCEVLLPLYEEKGLDMFRELDAEFALIIYDHSKGEFIAARDPIGIRPLFYAYNSKGQIMFASEIKNLLPFSDTARPFPPGHYYAGGKFVCYNDIAAERTYNTDELPEICRNIRELLSAGINKRLDADAPLGFLLSGGLDSSLVCSVAAKTLAKPIRTFAVGMTDDAIDLKYAREAASFIGSEHEEIIINKELVISSLDEVIRVLETFDITTIRASIGMYLICKAIHEKTDVRVLLTGEISDEIFGYKYTDFAPSPAEFQHEAQKRLRELYMYDVLRADRCIASNSIEARVPFGDLAFVEYVMSINPGKKVNVYGKGKYLLRKAFEGGGYLPESLLMREKAAFSDAVGHSMVDYIKEFAEMKYSGAQLRALSEKYSYHAKPFTKESLLYREIFEKYYPGQATVIADFWMPNKEWEGCDVNDPSARVLANYGESGK